MSSVASASTNSPYERITVSPIAGSLGAEIGNVDISKPLDKETFDEVHRAWLENNLLVFRDQKLTPETQIAFAKQFGDIHLHAFNQPIDGYDEITELLKTPDMPRNSGNAWHTDQHYRPEPAKSTMLYCYECPEYGGDTQFANLYKAYDGLSDGLKKTLKDVRAIANGDSKKHQTGLTRQERIQAKMGTIKQKDPGNVVTLTAQPLIRTHPETGRKALYIGKHMECIDGWTDAESEPMLQYLLKHATQAEYVVRVRWRPGTFVMWDNRCTLHYAINDYPGERRRLHKIMVKGDKPF
ncbi:MAG: TauD/TfdA family dioxygenase [Proteobacteria bacterium]|nr:TauD/TfdA family dioxygenase [Pseudomonadota bacterium]